VKISSAVHRILKLFIFPFLMFLVSTSRARLEVLSIEDLKF